MVLVVVVEGVAVVVGSIRGGSGNGIGSGYTSDNSR